MKVKATDKFIEYNVKPEELDHIPAVGEEFKLTDERFKILTGDNRFNEVFVEEIETAKKEPKVEKAVKKTTKKSK